MPYLDESLSRDKALLEKNKRKGAVDIDSLNSKTIYLSIVMDLNLDRGIVGPTRNETAKKIALKEQALAIRPVTQAPLLNSTNTTTEPLTASKSFFHIIQDLTFSG